MKQQLEERLQSLKSEFESGQQMLAELEAKQTNLKSTLLRISGAIQVIEEILVDQSESNGQSNGNEFVEEDARISAAHSA